MKLLFRVVEEMKSLSNLIKSGFVAFSQNDKLIIDANQNKIIQAIDSSIQAKEDDSIEEAVAEAMIRDAELEGTDFSNDILTMDTDQLSDGDDNHVNVNQVASQILNSAKQEAEEIISNAHNEIEQLRASAYDEAEVIRSNAHEEGYHAGYEEAMSAANKEIDLQKEELEQQRKSMQEQFETFHHELIQETEHKMVEILCKMIPSVTGVVIEEQTDVLLYIINRAMEEQDAGRHFVIKLSSADYPVVVQKREDIYGASNPNIDIELVEDAKLSQYQCLIETDYGMIDLSLDVQLSNLITALKLMIKD